MIARANGHQPEPKPNVDLWTHLLRARLEAMMAEAVANGIPPTLALGIVDVWLADWVGDDETEDWEP